MTVRNVRFFALSGFLMLLLASAGVTNAQEPPHPNIGVAQKSLQDALNLLENEPPVFDNHKQEAEKHINAAIKALQAAIEYDVKHNQPKKDDKKK
jgi:hypothetical protein